MINNLFINNIGGIKQAELTFTSGFNVITGESGAGKSSVIRALELLTGIAEPSKLNSMILKLQERFSTRDVHAQNLMVKILASMNAQRSLIHS